MISLGPEEDMEGAEDFGDEDGDEDGGYVDLGDVSPEGARNMSGLSVYGGSPPYLGVVKGRQYCARNHSVPALHTHQSTRA